MADDSLIRVYSCWHVAEAEIVRARLASEGIRCWLENANLVLWCWHYANLTGILCVVFIPMLPAK